MALPKVVYNPGGGPVTLQFVRGPAEFQARDVMAGHDNTATSGIRERVVERVTVEISGTMPALRVSEDLAAWGTFMRFALAGGSFQFYPDAAAAEYYNCVSGDDAWAPQPVGPGRYSARFRFLVVPDAQAPANAADVLRRFYGVA